MSSRPYLSLACHPSQPPSPVIWGLESVCSRSPKNCGVSALYPTRSFRLLVVHRDAGVWAQSQGSFALVLSRGRTGLAALCCVGCPSGWVALSFGPLGAGGGCERSWFSSGAESGETAVRVIEGQVTKPSEGAWVGTRAAATQLPLPVGPELHLPEVWKSRVLQGSSFSLKPATPNLGAI